MKIIIKNADFDDFNELAKLARQGKINTFCMTDKEDERPHGEWKTDDARNTVCPFCGGIRRDNRVNYINFCNRCGAELRQEARRDANNVK